MTTTSTRARAIDTWAPVVALVALAGLALAGCAAAAAAPPAPRGTATATTAPSSSGTGSPTPTATAGTPAPTDAPAPTGTATPTPTVRPLHFDTPEAAMRYLARAWNTGDLAALRHVTNPASRSALASMHDEAVNMRFGSCHSEDAGRTYVCVMPHDYPSSLHKSGHGEADLLVAPAARYGWYASSLLDCG